ncbi:unnamed protein product [Penicillium pancosmium]
MRRALQILACCFAYPLIVSSKADPDYNASLPLRPRNVTTWLNDSEIYLWVGSYYNGTTKVEFTPEIGRDVNTSVCQNLQNQTFTANYESFIAITERGPYNVGVNPVNILLALWDLGTNLSSLETDSDLSWLSPSLKWYLESSPWVTSATSNSINSDAPITSGNWTTPYYFIDDEFNLTSSYDIKHAPYNLTGTLTARDYTFSSLDMDLAPCDTSFKSQYYMNLITFGSLEEAGWNWTYPAVELQFDSHTVNFTLDGYAYGAAIRKNPWEQGWEDGDVQGRFKVSFSGVIDPYHSDILVNTSSTPSWLRTVGFGNNSMNIGYGSEGLLSFYPSLWGATLICFIVSLGLSYF